MVEEENSKTLGSELLTIRSSLIAGVWGFSKAFSQSLLDLSLVPWDDEMNLTGLPLEQGSVLCLPLFRQSYILRILQQ